jgi:sugar phosphate isomerase/epimerase
MRRDRNGGVGKAGEFVVEKWPIGVFTSVDAGLGVHLDVVHELGIPTIQLHAPHQQSRTPDRAREFQNQIGKLGIRLTAVFGGFAGESYADIPTVERTVGLVPLETRGERLREMKEISDFARMLDCDVVALHLGFVPHDTLSAGYREIVALTQDLCDHVRGNGQSLHLETGQESADGLVQFIADTDCKNLFVNFDPANMILYGTGEPIAALRQLGNRVRSVHCKDAKWAANPGKEWGREMALGQGDVGMPKYLQTLRDQGYVGPLTIEREIPQDRDRQKQEIAGAVALLTSLRERLLG